MVSMNPKVDPGFRSPDLKVFVRDVQDTQGKKRPIIVRSWATVKDLKDAIQQLLHIQASSQRLYYGPLLTSGKELPNHRTLHDVGIDRSGVTVLLDMKGKSVSIGDSTSTVRHSMHYANDLCISSSMFDATPRSLRSVVQQARRGLAVGFKPDLALEGSGGTYFLHDSRKNKIAVFKPADEEPYADNNPRGYLRQQEGDSLRKGIAPGEACIREVAAFLLDHDGFAGVPMTTFVEARHPAFNTNGLRLSLSQGGASIGSHMFVPTYSGIDMAYSKLDDKNMKKVGSLQEFVRFECTIDDISPSKISVDEVHKIAIHDIRIMNADRNAANLIVRKKSDNTFQLVPIDHGYCLRSVCDVSWMDWCWLDWPQLKMPVSQEYRKYIANLDIETDAQMLRDRLNICEEAVDYFRASSALLKAGVAAGLTLYEIAIMCCRNDDLAEVPSMMEKLFGMASDLAHVAVENERWHHTAASRALEEQLTSSPLHIFTSVGKNRKAAIRKSFSSVELRSSPAEDSDIFFDHIDESPGLVQSCASDSSSEIDEDDVIDDNEDCEKWAEKIIADVSMEQVDAMSRSRRSNSVSSNSSDDESSTSSVVKGFWRVHPGQVQSQPVDEDLNVWAPEISSRNSPLSESFEILADSEQDERKTPKVSFMDPREHHMQPPATVSVSEFKIAPPLKQEGSGMVRSKSYAGLSERNRPAQSSYKRHSAFFSHRPNEDAYKKYFHKFIELVITRETTAALHISRHGSRAKNNAL